jgi:hypothetical protein
VYFWWNWYLMVETEVDYDLDIFRMKAVDCLIW